MMATQQLQLGSLHGTNVLDRIVGATAEAGGGLYWTVGRPALAVIPGAYLGYRKTKRVGPAVGAALAAGLIPLAGNFVRSGVMRALPAEQVRLANYTGFGIDIVMSALGIGAAWYIGKKKRR